MPTRKSQSAPLQRGLACLSCRKRKLKCCGTRPICTACKKFNRPDECEYDDKKQKSRTQKLQEKLALLQERVRELEANPAIMSSVEPSLAFSASRPSSSSPASSLTGPLSSHQPSEQHEPFDLSVYLESPAFPVGHSGSPFPSSGSSSSSSPTSLPLFLEGSSRGSNLNYGLIDENDPSHSSGFDFLGSFPPFLLMPRWNTNKPLPDECHRVLFDIFKAHKNQCSFDVDMRRFDIPCPVLNPPHPCLWNAIYLLACHYTHNPQCTEMESIFLTRSLHEINVALDKQDRLLDVVQASCLLAVYFYSKNTILEGYRHSCSAARLASGLGIHQILPPGSVEHHLPPPVPLPPPTTDADLRDRVAIFWQVFVIDRCWSTACAYPAALADVADRQSIIKTPWQKPSIAIFDPYSGDGSTLSNIYSLGNPALLVDMDFMPSLKAKAAALFERSCRLSSIASNRNDKYLADYIVAKNAVDTMLHNMPMFVGSEAVRTEAPFLDVDLFVIHTLVRTADIYLQTEQDPSKAINPILLLIRQLLDVDYQFLDPIVGACWERAARYLISMPSASSFGTYIGADPFGFNVIEDIHILLSALRSLGSFFPIAGEYARRIEEERLNAVTYA